MKLTFKPTVSLVFTIVMLALVALACRLPIDLVKETPTQSAEVNPFDAQAVEDILQNAQEQNGPFAFTITEEQLTSYITLKLDEKQDGFTIQNPSVSLDDSQILLNADIKLDTFGIVLPAEAYLSAGTNLDGELLFTLESIKIGNMNLSEKMQESLSKAIEEAMNSNLGTDLSSYRIDTIYIDEGMITISGAKR